MSSDDDHFARLMEAFERNTGGGNLKAANVTLLKMVRILVAEIAALKAAAAASKEA